MTNCQVFGQTLINFVKTLSNEDKRIINFLKKKAISQQYHTYFNWREKNDSLKTGKNANMFFSLFGDEFKMEMQKEVEEDDNLCGSVKAFIELGHLRNILVHSNFAAYDSDNKTTEEIDQLYESSLLFIEFLKRKLIVIT